MAIFCGDHGIAEEGVSAFPQEVTAQMVRNFVTGGAAISVLCRQFGITNVVVDTGVAGQLDSGALDLGIAAGTCNFMRETAMTIEQAEQALHNGAALAAQWSHTYDLAGVGEMGIANTTSASALLCAFTGMAPGEATGPGTGLDRSGVDRKADVIGRALTRHADSIESRDAIRIAAALGGFEIVTMAGFYLGAAQHRLPVVVDGFISSAAVLIARGIEPQVADYLLFSHASAEPAHEAMLTALGTTEALRLDMRLGEGSGAALLMPMIDAALALYGGMASFEEANVAIAMPGH